jgi:hypothetical protein
MAVRLSALRAGRALPSGRLLVLISVRLEDQLKNRMTASGIELGMFRLAA